jgi:hypothetical protein
MCKFIKYLKEILKELIWRAINCHITVGLISMELDFSDPPQLAMIYGKLKMKCLNVQFPTI